MAFQFHYKGGAYKPTDHTTEKFFLFFVLNGREVPFYQMKRDGLVNQVMSGDDEGYQTGNNVAKVFVAQQGYGIPKRYYSFYFRFVPEPAPVVTIKPFSDQTDFYFTGRISFLKKSQILALLEDDAESVPFIERQPILPVDTLKAMITVDKSEIRKNVRKVRIGKKRTKAGAEEIINQQLSN